MYHFQKNVFPRFFFLILSVAIFLSFTSEVSAQNMLAPVNTTFLSFMSSGNDTPATVRPRIVPEAKLAVSPPAAEIVAANKAAEKALLVSQLERQAFAVLNIKRAEKGLSQLVWSEEMAKIARSHSQDMAQYKYFSHAGRDGSMVDDRADAFGYKKWKAIGENIAYNRGYEKPAEFACERWMMSPSHRDNILNSRWKEAGIGVAITDDGSYYFTEVFVVN